jgi:hypothetical protein
MSLDENADGADESVAVPWDKECAGCSCCVSDLTPMETKMGLKCRTWALPNWWGPFCRWCDSLRRIQYPYLKGPALAAYVAVPAQRSVFRLGSLAYISIRAEGRTQINVDMIQNRQAILHQLQSYVRPPATFKIVSLTDLMESLPEIDPRSIDLVQLEVAGRLVLGCRIALSETSHGNPIETNFPIDVRLRTEKSEDYTFHSLLATDTHCDHS